MQILLNKFIRSLFVITCLAMLASSCSRPTARSKAQPRSALGEREVNKDYYKAPQLAKKKKHKKGKQIRPENPYVIASKKRYQKEARDKDKPQYSDPSYFGHKKPPKKRKRGKRKYCKECGMTH